MLRPALACLVVSATPALAQDAYLDDRSGPAALVRSLYNAINREEYARAWSYFSQPPAESVEAYAEGYEDTAHIDVIVGTPREEGAAGSIYYELPVAIHAAGIDGPGRSFAGCYTLRMSDPAAGEEFEPLHIEQGLLEPTEDALADALPRRCGDGPDLPQHDAALETVRALYANLDRCSAARRPWNRPEDLGPEIHEIGFNYDFDDADRPERIVKLYRFLCYTAAYNQGHVYFLADDDGEVAPLHFARAALDIRYAGERDEAVESMTVIGVNTYAVLTNSGYDPETRTITAHSRWRGMGDASSTGKWIFRQGEFNLVRYEVDASYDGEINPEIVVDYEEAP